MDIEEWRDIEGWEGRYQISSEGRVLSIRRPNEPRVMCLQPNKNREGSIYMVVHLKRGILRKKMYVHRLVAAAFVPNPDNLPVANHKDLNKLNNFASNFEWVTYKGNADHWRNSIEDHAVAF